jgi:DNA-binding cell septation regulator SpoVG
MDPKVEVVRMLVEKKGGVLATFTVKVTFDEKYQVHFPNMKVAEGPKGRFVSSPTRKSGDDFIPLYFLNKELLDLLRRAGMEAYDKALAGKGLGNSAPLVTVAAVSASTPASPVAPAVPRPGTPSTATPVKTWPRKEWKPSPARK